MGKFDRTIPSPSSPAGFVRPVATALGLSPWSPGCGAKPPRPLWEVMTCRSIHHVFFSPAFLRNHPTT